MRVPVERCAGPRAQARARSVRSMFTTTAARAAAERAEAGDSLMSVLRRRDRLSSGFSRRSREHGSSTSASRQCPLNDYDH